MGIIIVTIIGAALGWLAAIVLERDDHAGTAIFASAGIAGALAAALLSGDVALMVGVSAAQLLWSKVGALLAIVVINVAVVKRILASAGNV